MLVNWKMLGLNFSCMSHRKTTASLVESLPMLATVTGSETVKPVQIHYVLLQKCKVKCPNSNIFWEFKKHPILKLLILHHISKTNFITKETWLTIVGLGLSRSNGWQDQRKLKLPVQAGVISCDVSCDNRNQQIFYWKCKNLDKTDISDNYPASINHINCTINVMSEKLTLLSGVGTPESGFYYDPPSKEQLTNRNTKCGDWR